MRDTPSAQRAGDPRDVGAEPSRGGGAATSIAVAGASEAVEIRGHSGPARDNASRRRTYRAAVIDGPGSVRIEERPVPQPGPAQVRVRLEGCGVCGSNLAVWEGRPWFKYPLEPGAPGHEGWGRIDAVGGEVGDRRVGDRVAVLSYHAFAEYDVADATNVVPLPPALDGQPFPGEALGCAVNVFRRCDVRVGMNVAVIGIGFLGAVLTSLIARSGARVIAITRRSSALEVARRMGASDLIPMENHGEIIARVHALTNGRGCERVVEATGFQGPLDLAGELIAERGKLIIAGYHQDGARQVNMQLWNWRGIDVINAHERAASVYVDGLSEAVSAVVAHRLDPTPLYTHRFKLEELGEAFESLRRRPGAFLKALVTYA